MDKVNGFAHGDISTVSIFGRDIIHLGFHLSQHIARTVVTNLPASAYAIITDTNIAALRLDEYAQAFQDALPPQSKAKIITHAILPGEQSKSRTGKAEVEDFLLAQRCTRDTVLIALGGGVVGDLIGFVAATFMRGVRYVQVPTTLLAMVDSAVGGKTAIDVPLGKNLIGAFYQPEYVFIDAALLETLPPREFENGMAEIIKTAAIWVADDFEKLEAGVESIRAAVLNASTGSTKSGQTLATRTPSQALLLDVIRGSIAVKAHIVTIDEKETGLRNLVNFGHTIGHALEAVLTPHILHGECVAIGMVIEAEIARALGHLSNAAVGRISRCLASHGLPVSVRDPRIARSPNASALSVDRLLDVMRVDKKNAGPVKKVVLLSRIGKTVEERATGVADDVIVRALAPSLRVRPDPKGKGKAVEMQTPGSKSISNRVLVLAALAKGTCRLTNLLHSDDTQVMMQALKDMKGASFAWEDNGETLVVTGGAGRLQAPVDSKQVYLGNAGTAARFLTAVSTLAQGADSLTLTGNARMKQRPIRPLVDALTANGCSLLSTEAAGCMPLSIAPTGLRGGRIELAASLSSQYVSAVLLAAPYAQTPIELELVGGEVVSQLYIDMTIALMADFGVHVERLGPTTYRIPLGTYVSPSAFAIESDASSATYPLALAAITGTTCTLANIGTASLQGDARFAKDVLEPMGCTVRQTATSTTVTGPAVGSLRALSAIDMEPMTDAFMTAAVLAAVARGTTRITGIANQRVKECNRIEAMRVQLAKFGVVVRELPDGIEVDGRPPAELGRPVANAAGVEQPAPLSEGERDIEIFCYDDHRIAMAFSVLAAVPGGPGCVIEDRRCVEKTWPSWWDDLSAKLGGVLVDGVEPHVTSSTAAPASSRYPPDATIVLIGMRGAGKSYTGAIGAAALGRPLIDADLFFTEKEGVDIRDFVHANSWPAFRERELAHLEELLSTRPTGHIIAMGGGIVETPAAKRLLEQYAARSGPVVNVMRNIDEIVAYLGIDPTRPSLGEPIEEIAARRAPLFTACSTFDFHSYTTDDARGSRESIARFFRFVTGQAANQVDLSRGRSYFLPLTYPNVRPALPLLDELTVGVDAIELRVDLLATDGKAPVGPQVPPLTYVAAQLAAVRQRSSLPIVFTVRTASQGGFFPDAAEKEYFELLHQAVRWGCEYIDLQLGVDIERSKRFVGSRGASLVIASYHDWSGTLKWDSPTMRSLYAQLVPLGDVVKLVTKATSLSDNYAMMAFRDSVPATKPLMTLNMGSDGQLSRILNPVLSPVTHSLLPPSAPGQLSFAQTQTALYLLGQLPKKRFALLGSPIGHSKSPLIQNTGFQMLGLPYTYGLLEATEADEKVVEFLQAADFGGASVTIPMKLKIMPLLDEITPEAQLIGAVNTVLVRHDGDGSRKLIGTNTDWLGIRDTIARALTPALGITDRSCGLVIGAGGTSRAALHALHSLGLRRLYLYNRTAASAVAMADGMPASYGIEAITSLEPSAFAHGEAPAVIVSTVPGHATATTAHANAEAGVFLPDTLFGRRQGGVVLDAAYKPRTTPLIALAETTEGWMAIPGVMMLLEQGYHQNELFTGRKVARRRIEEVVLAEYDG